MSGAMANGTPRPIDDEVLARAATAERLLVASDFDGVLAPIVDDPEASAPIPESIEALARLTGAADTTVAIVSGRERRQLDALVPGAGRFHLVGSHGAEIDDIEPDAEDRRRLDELVDRLQELEAGCPGFHVEVKALSVAAHFRRIETGQDRDRAVETVDALREDWPAKVVQGKEVVEFTIATATKGDAIRVLGQQVGATTTVYLGDDVTDEDAFAVLGARDVGIKVGPGPTAAAYRVDAPPAVATLLIRLAELRSGPRR
jgi:trehalose 6-phosphate phosphatase